MQRLEQSEHLKQPARIVIKPGEPDYPQWAVEKIAEQIRSTGATVDIVPHGTQFVTLQKTGESIDLPEDVMHVPREIVEEVLHEQRRESLEQSGSTVFYQQSTVRGLFDPPVGAPATHIFCGRIARTSWREYREMHNPDGGNNDKLNRWMQNATKLLDRNELRMKHLCDEPMKRDHSHPAEIIEFHDIDTGHVVMVVRVPFIDPDVQQESDLEE